MARLRVWRVGSKKLLAVVDAEANDASGMFDAVLDDFPYAHLLLMTHRPGTAGTGQVWQRSEHPGPYALLPPSDVDAEELAAGFGINLTRST